VIENKFITTKNNSFNYYFKDLVYQYTQIVGCTIEFAL